MISAFTILSNAERYCYPYIESIGSILPVVDELVVVINAYDDDPSNEIIRDTFRKKVRIVQSVFDLRRYGWISYGIMRTTGYQACDGDIVVMFDADGVLHEKDCGLLKEWLNWLRSGKHDKVRAYWGKYRIYSKGLYWEQNKHSGIYNKKVLGDEFDFYHSSGKGIPNNSRIESLGKSIQMPIRLYGYEHLWDTREVLEEKAVNYGMMFDRRYNNGKFRTKREYFNRYISILKKQMSEKIIKRMDFGDHPDIIKERLQSLDESMFGYNFFNLI